jgi:hypothetical protein
VLEELRLLNIFHPILMAVCRYFWIQCLYQYVPDGLIGLIACNLSLRMVIPKVPEKKSSDNLSEKTTAFDFWKSREAILEKVVKLHDKIDHAQAKGESNEYLIRKILDKFLPPKYGIVEGFLIDHRGQQSRQTDIIIYDKFSHPYLFFDEPDKPHNFIPIDSAVATIEVKTTLKDSVDEAFNNIRTSREQLELLNPLGAPATWGEHFYMGHPSAFIFAYKSGWSKSSSIKNAVRKKIREMNIPTRSVFDLVYVQDKDVTLGWVYDYEGSKFLVRPCDHWKTPLHLTEITAGDSNSEKRLGLFHFLAQVIKFVSWFQVFPRVDVLLYHYGPPVKIQYKTDEDPTLIPEND